MSARRKIAAVLRDQVDAYVDVVMATQRLCGGAFSSAVSATKKRADAALAAYMARPTIANARIFEAAAEDQQIAVWRQHNADAVRQ